MAVDYIITSNVDKAIEAYRNTKFTNSSDIAYQKHFLSLPKTTQRQLLYDILISQAEVLKENVKACKDTNLPGFGTFKYREGKKRAQVFRDTIAQEYGYLRFNDIEDDTIKDIIIKRVDVIKRDVFISERIDRIKKGKSYAPAKVYTSFSKNS